MQMLQSGHCVCAELNVVQAQACSCVGYQLRGLHREQLPEGALTGEVQFGERRQAQASSIWQISFQSTLQVLQTREGRQEVQIG